MIEVKRADQSARQALHEVLKYAELLRREHSHPRHRIRLIVASTSWHELRVSFSALARVCDHTLQGVALDVDDSGTVRQVAAVDSLPEVTRGELARSQILLLWSSADARDGAWAALEPRLAPLGLDDMLGVELDYGGDDPQVVFPHALALVPGRMPLEEGRRLGYIGPDEIAGGIGPEELAEGLTADDGEELEGIAVNRLMRDYDVAETAEAFSFETFVRSEQVGWAAARVRRHGAFATARYVTDDDLLATLRGFEGENRVVFDALAAPVVTAQWEELRMRALLFLEENEQWQEGVQAWLERCEAHPDQDCGLHVYHLFDCVRGLLSLGVHGDPRFLDTCRGWNGPQADPAREIAGTLFWDGTGLRPSEAIAAVLGGLDRYLWSGGTPRDLEVPLLELMGLRHRLVHRHDGEVQWWRTDGTLGGEPTREDLMSLPHFVTHHAQDLRDLAEAVEAQTVGFFDRT